MCESEKIERPGMRRRLEFGAVPLQPWTAPYPDMPGVNYSTASLKHIHDRLDANIHIPIENGTVDSNGELEKIYKFCDISLTDAHMRRITYHYEHSANKEIVGDPEIVQAVHDGTATPGEMLQTLVVNPHLEAIELAKLSHPFDSFGDKAMMDAVYEALDDVRDAIEPVRPGSRRFKVKRIDEDIPALTVVEKHRLASFRVDPETTIDVIVRKSFIVRANESVVDYENMPRIDRLIKNIKQNDAREALFGHVSHASRSPETLDETPWLDILTTSVYANYDKSTEVEAANDLQ